jgi:hypothetical protein
METTRTFRESRFTHKIKESKNKSAIGQSFLEVLDSGGSTFSFEYDGFTYPAGSMKAMEEIIGDVLHKSMYPSGIDWSKQHHSPMFEKSKMEPIKIKPSDPPIIFIPVTP